MDKCKVKDARLLKLTDEEKKERRKEYKRKWMADKRSKESDTERTDRLSKNRLARQLESRESGKRRRYNNNLCRKSRLNSMSTEELEQYREDQRTKIAKIQQNYTQDQKAARQRKDAETRGMGGKNGSIRYVINQQRWNHDKAKKNTACFLKNRKVPPTLGPSLSSITLSGTSACVFIRTLYV